MSTKQLSSDIISALSEVGIDAAFSSKSQTIYFRLDHSGLLIGLLAVCRRFKVDATEDGGNWLIFLD